MRKKTRILHPGSMVCLLLAIVAAGISNSADNDAYFYAKRLSGWDSPVELSSGTSDSNSTMIAANASYDPFYMVAVYRDNRNGDYDWYYRESFDAGENWSVEALAVDTSYPVQAPWNASSLAVDRHGNIHLGWAKYEKNIPRDKEDSGVYYARFDRPSWSWSPPVTLREIEDSTLFLAPPVITVGKTGGVHDRIHLAYGLQSFPGHDAGELWYRRSDDGGLTWPSASHAQIDASAGLDIAHVPGFCADSNGYVYIAFGPDWYNGELLGEIYFRRSLDYGATWQPRQVIVNRAGSDGHPSLTCNDSGGVYMVFKGSSAGEHDYKEILYKHSNNFGVDWTPVNGATLLDSNPGRTFYVYSALDPLGYIHVAFDDLTTDATPSREAYYLKIDAAGVIQPPGLEMATLDDDRNSIVQHLLWLNGDVGFGVDEGAFEDQVFEVSCQGTSSGGGGDNLYQYTLRNTSDTAAVLNGFCVGTGDESAANYTFVSPTGFTASIEANDGSTSCDVLYMNESKTPHGSVPPTPATPAAAIIYFSGADTIEPNGTITFAFDNPAEPWDQGWTATSDDDARSVARPTDEIAGPDETYTFGYVHGPGTPPEPVQNNRSSFGGKASGGGGSHDYEYTVKNVSGSTEMLVDFCVGTGDLNAGNYTFQAMTSFTVSVVSNDAYSPCGGILLTSGVQTPYGQVPPAPATSSAGVIHWHGDVEVPANGTVTFAFDHPGEPWDHEWRAQAYGWSIAQPDEAIAGPSGTYTLGFAHGPGACDDSDPCTVDEFRHGDCVHDSRPDSDADGVCDVADNCLADFNPSQTDCDDDGIGDECDSEITDTDSDGVDDGCDVCPLDYDPLQIDCDSDGTGDVCDNDTSDPDSDGIDTGCDNCPGAFNPLQEDLDGDSIGDACDSCTDADGDGYGDPDFTNPSCTLDNCPDVANPGQEDYGDSDGVGDACDPCPEEAPDDGDADGYCDGSGFRSPKVGDQDNCPSIHNPTQSDADTDWIGDDCDTCTDTDSDGFGDPGFSNPDCTALDNCPEVYNPGQADFDSDLVGDDCDNCPDDSNPGQEDADNDEDGDLCDDCTDTDDDGFGDPDFENPGCTLDNCPDDFNPGQGDFDSDLAGDDCDNCSDDYNPGQEDGDADEVGDVCDNCPYGYNPEQGIAVFPPDVIARKFCTNDFTACTTDADCPEFAECYAGLFEWSVSASYYYVIGDFIESADIGSYSYSETNFPISDSDKFFPATSLPPAGEGHWYLFKPDCAVSVSWQTAVGAEPLRDSTCP